MNAKTQSQAIVNYDKELSDEVAKIKGTLGAPSSNVISTKGKLFTLPDGTSNPGPLQAIVLDYTSYNSYFKGIYDPNKITAPTCFAINKVIEALIPSPHGLEIQSTDCASCARNQFGSAPTGRGKACKNTRRIAIIPADATDTTVPMTLSVSPTGLKAFDAYVNSLARDFGKPPIAFITRISFNPKEAYPSLVFDEPKLHDKLGIAMKLRTQAAEMLNREPDMTRG